jgi:nucleoside-diphosphate-sugar epimerase
LKQVLVTGGFGFLGTHLVELVLDEEPDTHVTIVDNLSSNPVDKDDFLSGLTDPRRVTHHICEVAKYFRRGGLPAFSEVYHLASPVGPAGVLAHAGEMVRAIVRDTYLIMDYCVERGARLLDVSTSEIYGGGQQGYCPETTPRIVPPATTVRLEYAIGKLAAETAIINTCRVRGLAAVIVRPFNVAGPRQSPKGGFVLPRFIQQADANAPLTVFGNGSAIRAFTHVKDMVKGIALAMRGGRPGEAYNIGNPANKTTILELAKRVIVMLGSSSPISFVDPKTIYGPLYEEANDKYPDNEKARTEIGWTPARTIDDAIRDAYAEFDRQRRLGVLKDLVPLG